MSNELKRLGSRLLIQGALLNTSSSTPQTISSSLSYRLAISCLIAALFLCASCTTTPNPTIEVDPSKSTLPSEGMLGEDVVDEGIEKAREASVKPGKAPRKAPKKSDTWSKIAQPELGLSFKIPAHWETASKDELFFANPKPPGDDTVVIFMRVGSQDGVGDALTKLDQTFPMEKVRYTDQQKEEKINGMRTTFGEGVGFSKDFKTDLHFFIMLIDTKSDDYTLMAVYIKEEVFEARKPMVSEIIMSMNPIEAS